MNNYEKIKQMTVDEMAEWLCHRELSCDNCLYSTRKDCGCNNPFKQWLLQEVEE